MRSYAAWVPEVLLPVRVQAQVQVWELQEQVLPVQVQVLELQAQVQEQAWERELQEPRSLRP